MDIDHRHHHQDADTSASMRFLKPRSWPEGDKLYCLLYIPTDGMKTANHELHAVSKIPIYDVRPVLDTLSLDEQGFIVAKLKSQLSYHDFWDEEKLKTVYAAELRDLITTTTGAKVVFIHECVIRKRSHTAKPLIDGYGQPVNYVHTDYALEHVEKLIDELLGSDRSMLDGRRIQMLNCWKPLRGPLYDWPLALCDRSSVDPDDVHPVDEVYRTGSIVSQKAIYNPNQKWYYLKGQEADEVIIFKSGDTGMPGTEVPHGSFQDPKCPLDELPRESIEFRVMVVY